MTSGGVSSGGGSAFVPAEALLGSKQRSQKMSYTQAVSSSSLSEQFSAKEVTQRSSHGAAQSSQLGGASKLSSLKRLRSPNDSSCWRYFHSSHKTVEYRH